MAALDSLIGLFAPHFCLGCDAEGYLLCLDCRRRLPAVPARCYRCHRASISGRTCVHCRGVSRLYSVKVGTVYDDLAKRLVLKLKFDGARAAAKDMAKVMAPKIDQPGFYLVPVPTATRRARQRGYDQAKLLARELSRQTGLPYLDCLRRHGQAHQVGASRQQRLKQLRQSFRITSSTDLNGIKIYLVDDVITTGSTLEAAATACRIAGAVRVSAITFAQA